MSAVHVQQREDAALGAAWRRCEASRSEWESITLNDTVWVSEHEWLAGKTIGCSATLRNRGSLLIAFHKDTPTEALEALADALEARRLAE